MGEEWSAYRQHTAVVRGIRERLSGLLAGQGLQLRRLQASPVTSGVVVGGKVMLGERRRTLLQRGMGRSGAAAPAASAPACVADGSEWDSCSIGCGSGHGGDCDKGVGRPPAPGQTAPAPACRKG